jgi:transcriptional regulator with XRE-family HTH domain
MLPLAERLALQAEIRSLQAQLRERASARAEGGGRRRSSQDQIGRRLGVSQQVVNKILNRAEVGPTIAEGIYFALGTTAEELQEKHAAEINPPLTASLLDDAIRMLVDCKFGTPYEVTLAARDVFFNSTEDYDQAYLWARAIERRVRDNRKRKSSADLGVKPIDVNQVADDPHHPARAIAARIALLQGFSEVAVTKVRRRRVAGPDPGVNHWLQVIRDEEKKLVVARRGRRPKPRRDL